MHGNNFCTDFIAQVYGCAVKYMQLKVHPSRSLAHHSSPFTILLELSAGIYDEHRNLLYRNLIVFPKSFYGLASPHSSANHHALSGQK